MVENPEIGGQYWFVTDIWERFCPVPVTIVAVNEEYGAFLVRWDIGESEYFEQYEGVWPNELYETRAGAAAECRRRNALPSGSNGERGTTMPFQVGGISKRAFP